jgi:hypothetical protein
VAIKFFKTIRNATGKRVNAHVFSCRLDLDGVDLLPYRSFDGSLDPRRIAVLHRLAQFQRDSGFNYPFLQLWAGIVQPLSLQSRTDA